ncbi:hypothetical protein CRD36_06945 [Paremcibacter congregatus]|uniref:Calcium-binding protein n=1 Tax=Paremcibacter congregatus TaxID=2043170 RepID=A0A2G4YS10_9PROT|nr:hypothetical protein CRD36_06945 [Paremcibacter congregatus]
MASCQQPRGILVSSPSPEQIEPEFIEIPTNTFTARDNNNRYFEDKNSTENLTVIGKNGNDSITTGEGNDTIKGGAGNDFLVGKGGDDIIEGEEGEDNISGGAGNDNLEGGEGNDLVFGGVGDDTIAGGFGDDLLSGGEGIDVLSGEEGDDTFIFSDRASDLEDQFLGGAGYDTLQIAPKDLSTIEILGINIPDALGIDLGGFLTDQSVTANLSEFSATDIEQIRLNQKNTILDVVLQDVQSMTDENNELAIVGDLGATVRGDLSDWPDYSVALVDGKVYYTFGNNGVKLLIQAELQRIGFQNYEPDYDEDTPGYFTAKDDTDSLIGLQNSTESLNILGKAGHDWILTGEGADFIRGASGNDHVKSGPGDDVIFGDVGNDNLSGQEGNDEIYGGEGFDEIFGGNDDDQLHGGEGFDILVGGLGNDIIYGDGGNDILSGTLGNDRLFGGEGNDVLSADIGDNILYGGDGDDTLLHGVSGNDEMYGGSGDDYIRAGNGDIIDGGDGVDVWSINTNTTDFSRVVVRNMEEITLGMNPLTITVQDILDMTDANNYLIISGEVGATVTSLNQSWVQGTDTVINGQLYHSYMSGDATLLVDLDIFQDIS